MAQGIEREGPGLLQGLAVCGHCGLRMQTVYKHTPRYVCRGLSRVIDALSTCNSVRAPVVDDVVVQAFWTAIQPAQLDVLEAILQEQQTERQRLERQWQEQLKRVRYEAHLAQRQYDAVDPDNRLVTAELERRWEEKLSHLRQTEESYHHFQLKHKWYLEGRPYLNRSRLGNEETIDQSGRWKVLASLPPCTRVKLAKRRWVSAVRGDRKWGRGFETQCAGV